MLKSIFLIAQIVGVIAGKVVNSTTGEGIPSASVFVEGTTLGASTDKNGIYFIKDVPVGRYTLIATAVGFEVVKLSVVVTPDEVATVNFNLTPKTDEMKPPVKQTQEGKDVEVKEQPLNVYKSPKSGFMLSGGLSFPTSPKEFSDYWETGFNIGGSIDLIHHDNGAVGVSFDYSRFPFNSEKFLRDLGYSGYGISINGGSVNIFYISFSGTGFLSLSTDVSLYLTSGVGYFKFSISDLIISGGGSSVKVSGESEEGIFAMYGVGLGFKIGKVDKLMLGLRGITGWDSQLKDVQHRQLQATAGLSFGF
jgi:hypothetical protein